MTGLHNILPVLKNARGIKDDKLAPIRKLESYLSGGYVMDPPLLVGPSGVTKSAQVKALANKYNLRLVELRLALISCLDMGGLSSSAEKNDRVVSESAPASFMLECSDAYVDSL